MAPTQQISLPLASISIAIVFSGALLGALAPVLLVRHTTPSANARVFRYGNAFAAGILAAAAFVHLLPDGEQTLTEMYPDVDFPISGFLALFGAMTIFVLENLVRAGHTDDAQCNTQMSQHESHDISSFVMHTSHIESALHEDEHTTLLPSQPQPAVSRKKAIQTTVVAYILATTLSFHALIEGVTLGANVLQKTEFFAVMTAIMAHKVFAAFSLGISLAAMSASHNKAQMRLRALCAAVSFACVTPIGALIGLFVVVNSWLPEHSRAVFTAALNCISAGIFVYIAFVELLPDTTQTDITDNQEYALADGAAKPTQLNATRVVVARIVLFVSAALAMSVLALWT